VVTTLTPSPASDATVVNGLLTGVAAGAVTIAAKWGAVSNSTAYNVTIVANVLTATVVTPAAPTPPNRTDGDFCRDARVFRWDIGAIGWHGYVGRAVPGSREPDGHSRRVQGNRGRFDDDHGDFGRSFSEHYAYSHAATLTTISVTPPAASIALKADTAVQGAGRLLRWHDSGPDGAANWTATPPADGHRECRTGDGGRSGCRDDQGGVARTISANRRGYSNGGCAGVAEGDACQPICREWRDGAVRRYGNLFGWNHGHS